MTSRLCVISVHSASLFQRSAFLQKLYWHGIYFEVYNQQKLCLAKLLKQRSKVNTYKTCQDTYFYILLH